MSPDEFDKHLRLSRAEYAKRAEDLRTKCAEHEKRAGQEERVFKYQLWALLGAFLLGALGLILRVWP